MFRDVVTSEAELRSMYREPHELSLRKEHDRLDDNCRAFIGHSPFVLLATSAANGRCDVSPKGGRPGFVRVLDDTHVGVPDLSGNNRLDSLANVVTNPHVGLLFLIPAIDETLRVNGRAWLVRDDDVLDACTVEGKRPKLVVGVEVEEAYIHCGKAGKRSSLWSAAGWPDLDDLPAVACMLRDHYDQPGWDADAVAQRLSDGYVSERLWSTT